MTRIAAMLAVTAAVGAAAAVQAGSSGAAAPTYTTRAARSGAGVGFYSTAHISCPAGFHALGGGYLASDRVRVVASWPESDRTWAVRATSAESTPRVYYIYVRCRV